MIVILEGCNGVGKSAYASELASVLGAPVLRPFRPDSGYHWNGETDLELELSRLGVPVNTHVDDLYVADILGQLAYSDVILDRSVPSAIAYGSARDCADRLYDFWNRQLRRLLGVTYVWLHCPWKVAKERTNGRWFPTPQRYSGLEESFRQLFHRFEAGRRLAIDTKAFSITQGVRYILHADT